ncbi:MAG TPA: gamma-glutamyltransferase, partial [Gaiellales bacterium]|nr:gamma-glutamyltransferase [Gaiellales bacterium]
AALAGLRRLEQGGNAADAALAAAGVLAVVEPNQSGPGGDLFGLVLRDGHPPAGLNASGRAPADPGVELPAEFGPRSVTVPGCVAGWCDLAARYARFGVDSLLQPAIDLAERGFAVPPRALEHWRAAHADLSGEAADVFAPATAGRNPAIATALREAAAGTFYTGPVARAVASACWLSEDDLAVHHNDWVEPLAFAYRGHRVLELPPNGQGSIAGWALETLDGQDEREPSAGAQVEALAAAYARGYASIGGTSYVCAADGEGMAVSLIQSIYHGFGSRIVAPGYGFALQNRAAGFVVEQGHPNDFASAKRPFHTIMPAGLLAPDGRWTAAFGVTGGRYQPQGHVQVVVGLLDAGLDPQAVLDRPRYLLEEDGSVSLEPPLAELVGGFGRPARVRSDPGEYGNGHLIVRTGDGLLWGGSEPRRDGVAVGA